MTFVQISYGQCRVAVSGAELRNQAILDALRSVGEVFPLPIESLPDYRNGQVTGSHVKTVLNIEEIAQRNLIEELKRLKPDIVIIEGIGLLPLVGLIRSLLPSIKLVIDFHNVESSLLRETDQARIPVFLRPLSSFLFHHRWKRAQAAEIEAYGLVDAIWCCSETDRQMIIQNAGLLPVSVIPNPIPPGCGKLPQKGGVAGRNVLFVGHLGYRPNIRAALFAIKRLLPRLKSGLDGCQLILAGRSPGASIEKACGKSSGVTLYRNPESLRAFYEECQIVIIPLFEGGGTRIKVLEAMAYGRPIVATKKAVEGLGLQPGVHYLQAESANEFKKKIVSLLLNPASTEGLVAAASAHILVCHGPEAICRAVAHAVTILLRKELACPTQKS